MKRLVIFDSVFGNTERIARAIGEGLGEAVVLPVAEVTLEHLQGLEILLVGSPTRSWHATPAIDHFLNNIPPGGLKGVRVSAFDTRLSLEDTRSAFTRFIVRTGSYAVKSITRTLMEKGGTICLVPEGFLVLGDKGPLKEGELERAREWAARCPRH